MSNPDYDKIIANLKSEVDKRKAKLDKVGNNPRYYYHYKMLRKAEALLEFWEKEYQKSLTTPSP